MNIYVCWSAVVVVRPDLFYLIFPAHGRSWMVDLGRPWTKVADTSRPGGVRERSPIWKQLSSIIHICMLSSSSFVCSKELLEEQAES